MHETPPVETKDLREPDESTLEQLREHLDHGRYLSAWKIAEPLAPLKTWRGCEKRNIAARLVGSLGSGRLRDVLHLVNERRHPESDEAFFRAAFRRVAWNGPLVVAKRIEARLESNPEMETVTRADLLGLQGVILGRLRDLDPAFRAIDAAVALDPESSWLHVQRSSLLEMDDRYDEALETARRAVELSTGTPSAISQLSECLVHCLRDDEAIAVLEEAHGDSETAAYAGDLIGFYSEREDHERALHYLDEYQQRSPLLDKAGKAWAVRRRADFFYLAGDFDACLAQCDKTDEDSYHQRIAKRMREPGALERKRVRLEVPFVRQHEMTCAPATLASLAAYWNLDFDHLEIAEAICYDGTPWHKERNWAESNGFRADEFRLTREVLVELIDRGIPFTLTTQAVASAHLQACVGYDDRQGVALLRDPTERHYGEVILDGLIEDHPVHGPRCMLMLPVTEEARLEGVTLPDTEVYAANHRLSVALDEHDRDAAKVAIDSMPEGHPMTEWGRYRLAGYDRNPVAEFQAIDALAEKFPKNAPLRYSRLGVLHRYHDPSRQKELLEAELRRDVVDPVFYSEMGEFLLPDARQLPEAEFYLRKAVRWRARTGRVYSSLATCRWKQRRFEDAADLRRVAACLDAGWEPYASAYAEVCRVVSRPEEGLEFLRRRVDRVGSKSGGPWQTLAEELDTQRRTDEAMKVLEEAAVALPDDGELMLSSGRLLILWGERERGEALIAAARGKVRDASWLRESAQMAGFLGERVVAIERWRELLELEPYGIGTYRALARLIAEEEGTDEARVFLERATDQHAKLPDLWMLRAEWEAGQGPAGAIECLEKALALESDSSWCLREMAIRRSEAGDEEAALASANEAVAKDPNSPSSHGILARLLEKSSRKDEARAAFEKAVRLDVDYNYGSESLLRLARDRESTRAALRFIEDEMHRQVSDGSVVTCYRDLAYPHLEPGDLLEQLRGFCDERPDLWQTWSARMQQALDMEQMEEAFECGRTLTERFPVLPRAWTELATVHRAAGEYEDEITALKRAVDLSPAWDWAARQLATALERLERYDEALKVLERALQHEPLEGPNYGFLSDLLWKFGRRDEAFDRLLDGMRHCPSYNWGWTQLTAWSRELEREDEVVEALDAHRESRGHRPDWWVKLAEHLDDLGREEDGLAAIDEGLKRHPEDGELFEMQACLLGNRDRFEEALEACDKGLRYDPGNRYLLGRRAWVLMVSGKPNEAIKDLTSLVEAEPDYLWAIRTLTAWLNARSRWEELRDLAKKWLRQEPQAAMAYGYLGQAERSLENRDAAKEALDKAFALDPEYDYAGRNLLSYQIEDGELEAAEKTLRTLEHHDDSARTAADGVELAVARKDKDEALRRTKDLFGRDDATAFILGWVGEQFEKNQWTKDWLAVLDARVADGEGLKAAPLEAWVLTLRDRKKLRKGPKRLDQLRAKDEELAARGWIALIDVPNSSDDLGMVQGWIRKRGDWFRSRADLWAAVGGALTEVRDYKAAVDWLDDWKSRGEDVSAETLFNFGLSAEWTRGWQGGVEARERALAIDPAGSLSAPLRATVALQKALAGEMEDAQALGAEVEPDKLSEYYGGYHHLYCSVMSADAGSLDEAEASYRKAIDTFNQWNRDDGVKSFMDSARQSLADRVPWAEGKQARIQKRWGKYKGLKEEKSKWMVAMIIFLIYVMLRLLIGVFTGD